MCHVPPPTVPSSIEIGVLLYIQKIPLHSHVIWVARVRIYCITATGVTPPGWRVPVPVGWMEQKRKEACMGVGGLGGLLEGGGSWVVGGAPNRAKLINIKD